MSEHTATVRWERGSAPFVDNRYSRAHTWLFDGGLSVPASASPHNVRPPFCDPAGVDPEEAYVAALSSCHMLWFLSLAAAEGFVVDRYSDEAIGTLEKDEHGRDAITCVTLRPRVRFSGPRVPDPARIARLHDEAHYRCFIANSVRTRIAVESAGAEE